MAEDVVYTVPITQPGDPPEYEKLDYDGFQFPFEQNFDVRPTTQFLYDYYWPAVIGIGVVYLSLITIGQRWMRDRPAYELRAPLKYWNWALAIFSVLGAWRQTTELVFVWKHRGFMGTACTVSIAYSLAAYWAEKFAFSKVVELGDTAFLVLRKRPVTFLHWFHHVTVLAYTWHAVRDHTVAGRWFIWMNYSVHALMYAYYALMSSGVRLPRAVSASITTLQITQMFGGMAVSYFAFHQKSSSTAYCHQTWDNIRYCFVMYCTYMLLFLRYFYLAYISAHSNKRPPKVPPKTSKLENGVPVLKNGLLVQNGKSHVE